MNPCMPCVALLQALGVAVSAACGSEKIAFAVAPGITVVLMLFGKTRLLQLQAERWVL